MRRKADCSYTFYITKLGARRSGLSEKHDSPFTPVKNPGNPLRRLGGSQGRYALISEKRESFAPTGFQILDCPAYSESTLAPPCKDLN